MKRDSRDGRIALKCSAFIRRDMRRQRRRRRPQAGSGCFAGAFWGSTRISQRALTGAAFKAAAALRLALWPVSVHVCVFGRRLALKLKGVYNTITAITADKGDAAMSGSDRNSRQES